MADRFDTLVDLVTRFERVAITGGPRTGKSFLAAQIHHLPVVHTDDFIDLGWDSVPAAVIAECRKHPRFVVEGVMVPRSLRGAKDGSLEGLQVDAVIWLDNTMAPQTPKQAAMGRGVATVFAEWVARHREVFVVYPDK